MYLPSNIIVEICYPYINNIMYLVVNLIFFIIVIFFYEHDYKYRYIELLH